MLIDRVMLKAGKTPQKSIIVERHGLLNQVEFGSNRAPNGTLLGMKLHAVEGSRDYDLLFFSEITASRPTVRARGRGNINKSAEI
jgi:hypothetical protein